MSRGVLRAWVEIGPPGADELFVMAQAHGCVTTRPAELWRLNEAQRQCDRPSALSVEEREQVTVPLARRWPLRVAREDGRILVDRSLADADRVLDSIRTDEAHLVAWMAVTRERNDWMQHPKGA